MIRTALQIEEFYRLANQTYDRNRQRLQRTLVPKDVLVQDAVVGCWRVIDKVETAHDPGAYFYRVIMRAFLVSIRQWWGKDRNTLRGSFAASATRYGRRNAWYEPEQGIESVTEDHRFPFPFGRWGQGRNRPEKTGTTSRTNMRRLEDVRRDILDLNSKGVHNAEIARVLGISEPDVCRFLKANNRKAAKYERPTRVNWQEVVAAFDAGRTRAQLARDFGLSLNQIGNILRAAGRATVRRKSPGVSDRAKEILELNANGTRNKDIAELLGISQGAVSQMLKKHGKKPARAGNGG